MNEREKRDFQAGLEQEVDAFLRGDHTRRTFITRFGQMTGMLAVSGPLLASMTKWAIAQQKLELADPSSPLGQAQALAMKASNRGAGGRLSLPRRRSRQAIFRHHHQHDL